jgi:hypothetical protein
LIIGSILVEIGLVAYLLFPKDDEIPPHQSLATSIGSSANPGRDRSAPERDVGGVNAAIQSVRDHLRPDDAAVKAAQTQQPAAADATDNAATPGSGDAHVAAGSVAPAAGAVAKVTPPVPAAAGVVQPVPAAQAAAPAPSTESVAKVAPAGNEGAVKAAPLAQSIDGIPKTTPAASNTDDIVKAPPPSPLEKVAPPSGAAATAAAREPRPQAPRARQYKSASAWTKPPAAAPVDRERDPDHPGSANDVAAAMTDQLVRESARVKPPAQPLK